MVRNKIKKFSKEFKKTVAMAIAAAFGFITALAWRDVINEYLVNKISSNSLFQDLLISAIIITIISVLVIMWSSRLTSDDSKK